MVLALLPLLLADAAPPPRKPIPVYDELEPLAHRIEPLPGCHVYTGEVDESLGFKLLGGSTSHYTFTTRIIDGVWTDTRWTLTSPPDEDGISFQGGDDHDPHPGVDPLFGTLPYRPPPSNFKGDGDLRAQAAQADAARAPQGDGASPPGVAVGAAPAVGAAVGLASPPRP